MQGCALDVAEHEAVVGEPRAHLQPLDGLAFAVLAQRGHGRRVEGDRPPALCGLRLADPHLVLDRDNGLPDRRASRVEVEVGPAQPEDLAAACARRRQHDERRSEPVVASASEEGAKLTRSPRHHLGASRRRRLRRVGRVRRVARQPAPPHRVLEHAVRDRVDVAHRARRQAAPGLVPPAVRE